MTGYFQRALRAELRAGRGLLLLSVLGVALGVGSVLSIRILDQGALGAFEGTVRAVSGDAALTVVGNGPSFPEALYPIALAEPGVAAAVPLTRTEAAVEGGAPLFLEVLGVDLLAPVRVPWQGERGTLAGALGSPGWIAVTPELAAERGWKVGDAIRVSAGARRATLHVGALVDFRQVSPLASRRLAVMDIAEAQSLLGPLGPAPPDRPVPRPGRRRRRGGCAARVPPRPRGPGHHAGAAGRRGLGPARRVPHEPHRAVPHQPVRGRVPGLRQHAGGHGAAPRGDWRPAVPGSDPRPGARAPARRGRAPRSGGNGARDPARLARRPLRAPRRLGHGAEPLPARGHRPRGAVARAPGPRRRARRGGVPRRRPPSGPRRLPPRPSRAARLADTGGADLPLGPAALRRGGGGSGAGHPGLCGARAGSTLGGLPGGARHPGLAPARRAAARRVARERRPAPPLLLRLRRTHARAAPPVLGRRGGRAGGGGGHAHRDHRHGRELPRHGDRVARRDPARRPLRHHAHLEPRARGGPALPRGPRSAWPGIPRWCGWIAFARPSSGSAGDGFRWWASTRPCPMAGPASA